MKIIPNELTKIISGGHTAVMLGPEGYAVCMGSLDTITYLANGISGDIYSFAFSSNKIEDLDGNLIAYASSLPICYYGYTISALYNPVGYAYEIKVGC